MSTTFKVETFYRSTNCDCKAVIYIEHNQTVRFIKGSTLVFSRIYPGDDEKGEEKARPILVDTVLLDQVDTKNAYKLSVIDDFKVFNIESATMLLTGKDEVSPEMFWEEIF